MFECLCGHFGAIPADHWRARFLAGRVQGADGRRLGLDEPFVHGLEVRYFREVAAEVAFNAAEQVLFRDEHLLVADKPHFLPVMATGRWVEQTLQARLERRLGLGGLIPLHRLDRGTAGLVLLAVNPASRGRYQALFRERRIVKFYEAIAAPLPHIAFPVERRSHLARGEPFFRMTEIAGDENAITRFDVIERGADWWRYRLEPVTGRKHQLRVHMAALGAPIRNDPWYPSLRPETADDPARPLGLVARGLEFVDPISGVKRCFRSLMPLPAL